MSIIDKLTGDWLPAAIAGTLVLGAVFALVYEESPRFWKDES